MTTDQTANSLSREIDRLSGGQPTGKLESHSVDSLCRRLLAPREVVLKLLGDGVLCSQGPVHANDETGAHSFLSNDLNAVRSAVLAAICERVVEESDGEPAEVTLAAGDAMRSHAAGFEKKLGTKAEFSRFPVGVVQLASPYGQEEEPSTVARVAKAGAVLAGGAALVGGAGYLRGRLAAGANRAGMLGAAKTAGLGFRLLRKDATAGVGAVKSAFAPRVSPTPSMFPSSSAAPAPIGTNATQEVIDPLKRRPGTEPRPGFFSARGSRVNFNASLSPGAARVAAVLAGRSVR